MPNVHDDDDETLEFADESEWLIGSELELDDELDELEALRIRGLDDDAAS